MLLTGINNELLTGINNELLTGINNVLLTGINNILLTGICKQCIGNWDKQCVAHCDKQYVGNWDKGYIYIGYWDVTPRGPGGGAPWQAQSACRRQAQRSGAMPKAWVLGLSIICATRRGCGNDVCDKAWGWETDGLCLLGLEQFYVSCLPKSV